MARPQADEVAKRLVILKFQVVYALSAPPRQLLRSVQQKWSEAEQIEFTRTAEAKRDEYWQPVHALGMWDAMSPREQEFANTTVVTMTSQQQVDASWRMESAVILMWALQLIDTMPEFDTLADNGLLKQIPPKAISQFFQEAALRPVQVINRARDIAEFWHWRSRTRQLQEQGASFRQSEPARRQGLHSFDDVVRLSARKAYEKGTLANLIDEDFPARGKAYRDLDAREWAEVGSITQERHYALNWLCGYAADNRWDETPTDT